jgi:large repetitive protein
MAETFFCGASSSVSRARSAAPSWLRAARALALGLATTLFAAVSAHANLAVSQSVSNSSIVVGERTRLTITLSNDNTQVDNATLTNTLPPQLRLYNPSFPGYVAPASSCAGAALTPQPGNPDQLVATGFSIPGVVSSTNGECSISFDITSVTAGTWVNVIAPTDLTPTNATGEARQSLLVTALQNVSVSKAFANNPLTQGLTTTATVTFSNPNNAVNVPLTSFTDNLPASLEAVGVIGSTCGGTASFTATSVTLTGGAIPAGSPGTCNLQFTVRGVLPANTPSQADVNSLPAGSVGNTRGLTSPLNNTNITVNSPIALSKGFSVTPLTAGSNSLMTVRITNNSAALLTSVGLSDVVGGAWPAEVLNAGPIGVGNLTGCGAGATLTAGAGGPNGTGFVLAGGEIVPNGGECVISFNVTSTAVGTWTNSLPAGAVANAQSFTSPARAASINVRNNALTVAKTISPNTVAPGDVATFAVSVTSFNIAPQTNVSFTDTLPAGMVYVDATTGGSPPTISGGCTFSAAPPAPLVTAPTFAFDFPGAAPGGTTCVVRFTARVPANAAPNTVLTNGSFGAGNGTVTGTSGAVSLTAVNPLVVTKTFDGVNARQRFQGSPSVAQIALTNNNFSALANVSFTDMLPGTPGQIRVADPANAVSTCGGTVTANPGDTSFTLTGGAIPARGGTGSFPAGECSVRVNVVGGTVGVHSNTIPAYDGSNAASAVRATGTVANQPNTSLFNLNATTATLEYLPALTVAKVFLTNPVQLGGTSRVRITLGNTGSGQLTGVRATDPLAGTGLLIATPANASTTCAGPTVLNVPAGGNSATITGATLAGTSTCDFLFDVVTSTGTPSTNTLAPGAVSADGGVATTTATSATLNKISSSLNLTKAFSPNTLPSPGSVSRLTITIGNNSADPLTNLAVTDNLPSGMVLAAQPNPATTCAGGIVEAVSGATQTSLSGGGLAANGTCTVSVDVTAFNVGTLNNTLPAGAVTNSQGLTNASPFTANLAALAALGVEKSFEPAAVNVGQPAVLVIRVRNALNQVLNNITGTDNLPAGLLVAVPANVSTTCVGAVITATGGRVSFRGAQLAVGPSSCEIRVSVVAASAGAYVNRIPGGTVVANDGAVTNPPPDATATLNVLAPPTIAKAFAAAVVAPSVPNRLTVTVSNPSTTALTGVALRDNLPASLFVAQVPNASTTCAGGTVSAIPSGSSAQLAGATVPANGSCIFAFDTVSNVPGLYTNTIPAGALTSQQGVTNADPATAPVRVLQPPTVAKTFVPPSISPNGVSRLTITLGNANAAAQTLSLALDDNLPAGVQVAASPNVVKTCPGAVTATAGTGLVRYASGASIPAGGCTIEVSVTASVAGNYPNQIFAGALVTNAGSNPSPATADLTVSPLGSVSGRIYLDGNNTGAFNAGEAPLAGQSVSLVDAGGVVLQKTTTDAGGFYTFKDLPAATYGVRYLRSGSDSIGSAAVTPSPALNALGNSFQGRVTAATPGETTIAGGTGAIGTPANSAIDFISRRDGIVLDTSGGNVASAVGVNFGELRASEISGKVYRDDNNNGAVNGTEPGLPGVPVTLAGLDDLGQAVLLNTNTDASGNYSFPGLRPSCSPLAAPACPGYVITEGAQPADTANGISSAGSVVSLDTGAAIGTVGTGSNTAPAVNNGAPAYTIPAGTSRVAGIVLPPNARSANNNFGELASNRSVSGQLFTDNNGDGVFNGSDAGVGTGAPGANNLQQTLTLSGNDLNGNPVSITTTTDASGNYRFDGVPPGSNYTVTCTSCAPPAGFINSTTPLAYPGSTGGTPGGTQAVPAITGINLSGNNTSSVNNRFTKTPPGAQISGSVYFDPDNSGGVVTPDDLPVPTQTIELRDNATNALVATATTGADGGYRFVGIPPGSYRVVMPGLPAGTSHGITSAGTLGGSANGTATAPGVAPAAISGITVGADQTTANHNFPLVSDIRIGGRVYEDRNFDGQFNGSDVGLPSNAVGLVGTDAFGNAISRSTVTDGSGQYSFTGLPPGSYTVRQTQPLGYTSVANTPGPVTGGSAGLVGPLGGAVETLAVSFNATPGAALQMNFGETLAGGGVYGFKSARIVSPAAAVGVSPGAEVVWQVIYKNDTAYPVALDLRDTLPDFMTRTGAPAISSSTGNGGVFTPNAGFTGAAGGDLLGAANLPAGAWVAVNIPVIVTTGATTTRFNQARTDGAGVRTDTVDATTPTGGVGQPPAGVIPPDSLPQTPYQTAGLDPTGVPLSALPASLSGSVWRDNNSDRQRDAGDTPIPDWAVELVDSSGQTVACRTAPSNSAQGCIAMPDGRSLFRTGADGSYGVIGLVPGDYKVFFRDPANNVIYATPQNTGGDASSSLSVERDSLKVSLLPGASLKQQDLPLDPSGVIYDSVTRAPIDGSQVRFCGPAGFNPATMLVGGASYTAVGNCAQMVTGPQGFYQFLLAPGAPSGAYTLEASAPNYAPAPSGSIPPAPGTFTPSGPSPLLVQAQAGPPAIGQPTTYYVRLNLAPGMPDLIHNHIPLDPFTGAGLFLQKQVQRSVVEIGDSVQYTLRLLSPNGAATNVVITDNLPAGLRLIPGTVTKDGVLVADPAGSPGPVLNFAVGNFAANTPVNITYRVRVGVGSQQGDGINRALANGQVGGVPVQSNRAQARIRITGGVFFQEACVLGKVFVDCNRNRIQDAEEVGIPGVRFYLQDGTHLVSDSEGKYSICGLPARTSVMRVDTTTLPAGSELVTSSNRNALDAGSLFLDLKFGELHRADFIEGSCSREVLDQVFERRRTGQVVSPLVDPPISPPRVFRSGPPAGLGGAQ